MDLDKEEQVPKVGDDSGSEYECIEKEGDDEKQRCIKLWHTKVYTLFLFFIIILMFFIFVFLCVAGRWGELDNLLVTIQKMLIASSLPNHIKCIYILSPKTQNFDNLIKHQQVCIWTRCS